MIQRIAMHYKQLQYEHAMFSVFDETFYKKYRASMYPCFFVSEYEVALYNMLCTYCFDITNGNTTYIPYCFDSVQSLMSYTYEHAQIIDHISPRFFDIVYSLFTSSPFLPLIDTYAQRFIPKHTTWHSKTSPFDEKALIKLSAAVSMKYNKNNTISSKSKIAYSSLLDTGLIVCITDSFEQGQSFIQRYASITKRPCITDTYTNELFSYVVNTTTDNTTFFSQAALTALTLPDTVYITSPERDLVTSHALGSFLMCASQIRIHNQTLYVHTPQITILIVTMAEYNQLFEQEYMYHPQVISLISIS